MLEIGNTQYKYTYGEYLTIKDKIILYIKENGPVTSKQIKEHLFDELTLYNKNQLQSLITHVGRLKFIKRTGNPYKYEVEI